MILILLKRRGCGNRRLMQPGNTRLRVGTAEWMLCSSAGALAAFARAANCFNSSGTGVRYERRAARPRCRVVSCVNRQFA
jgi:hypothetical protein